MCDSCDHTIPNQFSGVVRPSVINLMAIPELNDAIYLQTDFFTALLRGGSDFVVDKLYGELLLQGPLIDDIRLRFLDFSPNEVYLILKYLHDHEYELDLLDDVRNEDLTTFESILRKAFKLCECKWDKLQGDRKELLWRQRISFNVLRITSGMGGLAYAN